MSAKRAKSTKSVEHRIDEVARLAGTTVRNVRAYQERGLLPAPRREGRVAWYSAEHLARLRLIGGMLARGYSLANIGELVEAQARGRDIAAHLGLEKAVGTPFSDERPISMTPEELVGRLGGAAGLDPALLGAAMELGLVEPEGARVRIPSPKLLDAAIDLDRAGVPARAMIAELRALRADVERIAERFVDLVAAHVFDPHGDALPPPEAAPGLAVVVEKIRPLARVVVESELARALDRKVLERVAARADVALQRAQTAKAKRKKRAS